MGIRRTVSRYLDRRRRQVIRESRDHEKIQTRETHATTPRPWHAPQLPSRNLVIAVDERVIRLQGAAVVTVADAVKAKGSSIPALARALRDASVSVRDITDKQGVTIMGDREIPYALLKKIMLTCAGAEYTNISFAVTQKALDS